VDYDVTIVLLVIIVLAVGVTVTLEVRRQLIGADRSGGEAQEPASEHPSPPPTQRSGQEGRSQPGRPPEPGREWLAEIAWRKLERGAVFVVVARSADGVEAVISTSDRVEWPPRSGAAIATLERVVSGLETTLRDAGWSPLEPGGAWYAKRFEWAARDAAPVPATVAGTPTGRFRRQPAWPADSEALWRCEIKWDAGYVTSRYIAVMRDPGSRSRRTVAASEPYSWMFRAEPEQDDPGHASAVRGLVAGLEQAGWERVEPANRWWAHRFVWRRADPPPEHLELSPADASA
jgi:hypothetical protein